jgi:hypothetical protein
MTFSINIHGSAHRECDPDELRRAHELVRVVVREVLAARGSMVVFVTDEPRHATHLLPTVFDWTVVEEALGYCDEQATPVSVKLITGTGSIGSRIPEHRYKLLQAVQARSPHVIEYIPEHQYTGGVYRELIARHTHGVIALGGGKGVTALYDACGSSAPFVPVNTTIGRPPDDEVYAKGSRKLWNQVLTTPEMFLRFATEELRRSSLGLNLAPSTASAGDIARTCVRLLWDELTARATTGPVHAEDDRGEDATRRATSEDRISMKAVVDELAKVFWESDNAVSLAAAAGFPKPMMPAFKTPLPFWEEVAHKACDGAIPGGLQPIIDEAAKRYPSNACFGSRRSTSDRSDT